MSSPSTVRGLAIERVIRVAQALQRVRFGVELGSLAADINQRTGRKWALRTLQRDLEVLAIVGLVDVQHRYRAKPVYRWIGEGGFFEQPATAVGLARDELARNRPELSEVA